jgi:hypothetical protein
MNRREKIHMLLQLKSGKLTVNDLQPKNLKIHVGATDTCFMINDKEVTEEAFNAEMDKQGMWQKPQKINVQLVE